MTQLERTLSRSALASFLVFGAMSAAALAEDLSRYRGVRFGMDLPAVSKQVGVNPSDATAIHSRPALIQELEWRPQPVAASSQTEQAKEVIFSFYRGELFRIAVKYDRYETEGMTVADFVEAITGAYGLSEKPASAEPAQGRYEDQESIVARWQDSDYCWDLVRSSYGPSFQLVGVAKKLATPANAAITEAKRLDLQEAPQRDASRIADEKAADRARLEQSRLVNKPKFRP